MKEIKDGGCFEKNYEKNQAKFSSFYARKPKMSKKIEHL